MNGYESRKQSFLQDVDKWRMKFSEPLSRKQALEVLIDNRRYDKSKGEFIDIQLLELYKCVEAFNFANDLLKSIDK